MKNRNLNRDNKKKTSEKKNWVEEIKGIIYLAFSLLLFVSLVSYSPDDPSLNSVSTSTDIINMTGIMGAYISDLFFSFFGGASYIFPIAILINGWRKLRGGEATYSKVRYIGFFMLLLSLPAFLHINFNRISLSVKGSIPAGGLVGDIISSLLVGCCATFGTYVITFTTVVIAAVMATGLSPVRVFRTAFNGAGFPLSKIREIFSRRSQGKAESINDETESFEDITPNEEPEELINEIPKQDYTDRPRIVEKNPLLNDKITLLQEQFEFINSSSDKNYKLPSISLLNDPPQSAGRVNKEDLILNSNKLEAKFLDLGVQGQIVEVHPGPVITMYEFEPAPGVKLSKIVNLSDDLALAMKCGSVRIVAPLHGRSTVGIEIPNHVREDVYLKEILASEPFRTANSKLTMALGKDISGSPVAADLTKMPHLLVAGTTGSGKSVALNSMISSLLFISTPADLKMVMIDPKILELSIFEGIPHLLTPVITQPKEAAWVLQKLVEEMQRRYRLLADRGVRNIGSYNKAVDGEGTLPYIVVIIDELADLMMTAQREVEDSIARLAQMARAAGIHLIVATQRPSVDVLTGIIKANFPTRMSFKVSSKTDSRTILDANGAEALLDKGDMLFLPPGTSKIARIHGSYISDTELNTLVDYLKTQGSPDYSYKFEEYPDESVSDAEKDEFYQQAIDLVLSSGQASISLIQRRLRIGFNRAARLVEMMEEDGFVGPATGGKPREVLRRKDV
ncbi:MAG: DNA translocase FtsK [Nitrospirae bacterium]|nr:DNA translocase FtsK [Nitrospirota bacterium]